MDPPFQEKYKSLFNDYTNPLVSNDKDDNLMINSSDGWELPLIDLQRLTLKEPENIREKCVEEIRLGGEWGNPRATCLRQLAWSEAFHVPLTDISRICDEHKTLR
ncbi:hypothetical protein OIU85_002617 [Salix viminalis]|uniref:Uncharacterized protein n=1 Tax=Salix viminalis TaxID=40686 RepID=A0A9Q0VPG2_SALVM|nr:hypothetical protein OIU85_002617 [Salix viminalis]